MPTVASYPLAEINDEIFAVDAAGNMEDLGDDPTSTPALAIPAVVLSLTGRGREFGADIGLVGVETTAGLDTTRLDRDVTVRCFMSYEISAALNGDRGTVVARGREDATATERRLFGVELERVNATTARVRARWEEISGTDAVVAGATFIVPAGFFHLAVVRRWINTTTVEVDYVVNDELIGTETVSEGDIGEGSGGTLSIGCAGDPASPGDYERFLPTGSIIDQLSIESDAMTVEELRQEFRRITIHQPNGYRILRAFQPPGEAWNRNVDSRIQKLFAACGDGLGHAIGLIERLRDDYLPDRAYNEALAAWENLLGLAPMPGDQVADRRTRVLGFLRRILGYQIDDVKFALEPLFNLTSAQIDILEYDALRTDDFSTDDITTPPSKIWVTHDEGLGSVSIGGGTCSIAAPIAATPGWITDGGDRLLRETSISSAAGKEPRGATLITQIDVTGTISDEVIYGHFWRNDWGDALVVGRRLDAATNVIAAVRVTGGVVAAVQNLFTPGAPMADPIWLLSRYVTLDQYKILFSETSGSTGFEPTIGIDVNGPESPQWCGFGVVAIGAGPAFALTAAVGCDFDDAQIYEPAGLRPFNWQALRDPGLGGTFDLEAAQAQLEKQKPAHTEACAVEDTDGFTLGPTGTGKLGCDPLFPANQIVS